MLFYTYRKEGGFKEIHAGIDSLEIMRPEHSEVRIAL
jgi:hypothetical protein